MQKAASVMGTSKKKLRMASPQDVYEATQCVPGAVPPFGNVFGMKVFMDESVQTQGDVINFNAVSIGCGHAWRCWHCVYRGRL